jgi:hypothetical protein
MYEDGVAALYVTMDDAHVLITSASSGPSLVHSAVPSTTPSSSPTVVPCRVDLESASNHAILAKTGISTVRS